MSGGFIGRSGKRGADTELVSLGEGRWTTERPGESPSEAMNRLTAGDGEPLSSHPSGHLIDRAQRPHFE